MFKMSIWPHCLTFHSGLCSKLRDQQIGRVCSSFSHSDKETKGGSQLVQRQDFQLKIQIGACFTYHSIFKLFESFVKP